MKRGSIIVVTAVLLFLLGANFAAGSWTLLLNQSVYNETRSMPCSTILDSAANPKPTAILAFDVVVPKEIHKCTEFVVDIATLRSYANSTARYRVPNTTHFWLWSNVALNSRFNVQIPPLIAQRSLPLAGDQSWETMTKLVTESSYEISTRRYVWPNLSLSAGTYWIGFSVAIERNHLASDRTKNEIRALATALGTPRTGSLAYRFIDAYGNFYSVTYPGLRNWTNASAAEPLLMPQFTPGARSSGTGEIAGAVYGVCQGLSSGDSRILSTLPPIYAPPNSVPVTNSGLSSSSSSPTSEVPGQQHVAEESPSEESQPVVDATSPPQSPLSLLPASQQQQQHSPATSGTSTVSKVPPPSHVAVATEPLPAPVEVASSTSDPVTTAPPVSLNPNIIWGIVAAVLVLILVAVVTYFIIARKNSQYINMSSQQMVEYAKDNNLLPPNDDRDAGLQPLDDSYSDSSSVGEVEKAAAESVVPLDDTKK